MFWNEDRHDENNDMMATTDENEDSRRNRMKNRLLNMK